MNKEVLVKDLVRKLNLGDECAFRKIYDLYYPQLLVFSKAFIGYENAKDVVANVFIKVWEQRDRILTIENLSSFLFTMARNSCLNFCKYDKYVQTKQKELETSLQQDFLYDFELSQLKADIYERIGIEVERLPKRTRDIFKLAFLDGLQNSEIANLLGLDEQTVRNTKTNALKRLRLAFDKKPLFILLIILFEK
jgi:RNA polymerase sigma-70 factor (family 1)